MAKTKKKTRKSKPIVEAYLERIGQKVFKDFSSVITGLIRGNQGIYALYKKDKLYYIGLAGNLKIRIKHHLNDKHKNCWTHFSLYIISKQEHIKEFESVILRVAYPKGNSVRGKLSRAENLRPTLKIGLKKEWERQIDGIIGGRKKEVVNKTKTKKSTLKVKSKDKPLKGMFPGGKMIYAAYKGKEYKAWVLPNGIIKLIPSKQKFNSPSLAGIAVTKTKTINGWKFWKYKNQKNQLVYIDTLRK